MLKIPAEPLRKWEPDQAGAVRTFLNTAHGQALLQQLYQLRPSLEFPSASGPNFDSAKRAAEAEFIAGFESCIQTLLFLTVSPN